MRQVIDGPGNVGVHKNKETALVYADEDINFVVRPVDADRAMSSTRSFGRIFNQCRERVGAARRPPVVFHDFSSLASQK